jgi:UDP-2,3-diacylglucosamine pyrophosphatase LpxH
MKYEKAKVTFPNENHFRVDGVVSEKQKTSILLMSDLHIDSVDTDRKFLEHCFEEAKKRNAIILIFGDLFDAMGGRNDKRTGKGDLKKNLHENNYYDMVGQEVADFLIKCDVLDLIKVVTLGNHETAVTKHNEVSLLESLKLQVFLKTDGQHRLNTVNKYAGFFRIVMNKASGSQFRSWNAWYNHGSGGGAPMTFGVLKTKRRQAVIDADIFISGHTHQAYTIPLARRHLTKNGHIKDREILHVQLGTAEGPNEFSLKHEFGFPSKSYYFLNFYYRNKDAHLIEERIN